MNTHRRAAIRGKIIVSVAGALSTISKKPTLLKSAEFRRSSFIWALNSILHGKSHKRNTPSPSGGPATKGKLFPSSHIPQGHLLPIVIPRTRSYSSLLFMHIVNLSALRAFTSLQIGLALFINSRAPTGKDPRISQSY